MPKIINKPWGSEEIIEQNDFYVVKRLIMHQGERCSLQYHEKKIETIYVISGILIVTLNDIVVSLYPNDYVTILNNVKHRMEADMNCIYLESSTPQLDDLVRVEDDYGRIE